MTAKVRQFQRTLVGVALSAAALSSAVISAPGVASQESFAVGSGKATAKVLRVGPARGALSLAPEVGLAFSDFLNTRGRGDVRTADFAALSDSVPKEIRDGLPSVKVESTDDNAGQGKTVTVGTPPEVPAKVSGVELHADAGKSPSGSSAFTAGAIDLGVGTVSGARAEARSGIVKGNVREAVARVVIPRLELAGGAVVLENLQWLAIQRTGAEQLEQAAFTIGAATVAGQTMAAPTGDALPIAAVAAAIKPVLDPLGLTLTLPEARTERGSVSLSALRLRVSKSAAAPALIPVTDAIQPARETLVDAIRSQTDQADAVFLVTDVALGVITGGSDLDIALGGVSAVTAPPAAGFQFGSAGGFHLGATSASGSATLPPAAGAPSAPTVGAVPPVTSATDTSSGSGDREVALESRPVSSDHERGGPLLAVGLLGLAAAAAMALADYRKIRAGARIIPA
jgi:hypothetical protein